jgi:putative protein-disulfide isomerase
MMKLIYIMDPLCGWCYGNSDNVLELFEKYKNEIKFEILPGGMWVGENITRTIATNGQFLSASRCSS